MRGNDQPPTVSLLSSSGDGPGGRDGSEAGGGDGPDVRHGPAGIALLAAVAVLALALVGTERGSTPAPPTRSVAPPLAHRLDDVDPARTGDGPVLGGSVGAAIAIGGSRHDLHLIDLDTGDVSSLQRSGTPRLIDEGRLLAQDDRGRWEVIDLTTGDVAAMTPAPGAPRYAAVVAAEADGVWFRHAGDLDGRRWSRVRPETGEVLQQVTLPVGASVVTDVDGLPLAGPEIVGSEAGEIHVLGADGRYRRRLYAQLIAFNEDLLLVSTCELVGCATRWLDRRSLEVLDLPAPDAPLFGAYIRGDTTLVAETSGSSSMIVKVFDIATNRAIATGSPSGLARTWVSPSGRYLAVPGFDALLITDIEGSRTAMIDRLVLGAETQLAWGRN